MDKHLIQPNIDVLKGYDNEIINTGYLNRYTNFKEENKDGALIQSDLNAGGLIFSVETSQVKVERLRNKTFGVATKEFLYLEYLNTIFSKQKTLSVDMVKDLKDNAKNEEIARENSVVVDLVEMAKYFGYDDYTPQFYKELDDVLLRLQYCLVNENKPNGNFRRANIVSEVEKRNKYLKVTFSPLFLELSARQPRIITYPSDYFRLSTKSPFLIPVARYLNKQSQQKKKRYTNNRLKVKNILSNAPFMKIEEIREKNYSWNRNLKNKLEVALDEAVFNNQIYAWTYGLPNGKKIKDKDIDLYVKDYENWSELLLYYINQFNLEECKKLEVFEDYNFNKMEWKEKEL